VGEANQLLDEIYGERWQTDGSTPIILIGHSLGGILIKQALVNAWANEKYRGIKEATYGGMGIIQASKLTPD
jgi:triacylglycerol esterase/lipase EstA (alpha/beta hydrolase family)